MKNLKELKLAETKQLLEKVFAKEINGIAKELNLTEIPTLNFIDNNSNGVMFVGTEVYTKRCIASNGNTEHIIVDVKTDNIINVNVMALQKQISGLSYYCGNKTSTKYDLIYVILRHECRHIWQANTGWRIGQKYNPYSEQSIEELMYGHGSDPSEKDANDFAMMVNDNKRLLLAKLFVCEQNIGLTSMIDTQKNMSMKEIGKDVSRAYRPMVYTLRRAMTCMKHGNSINSLIRLLKTINTEKLVDKVYNNEIKGIVNELGLTEAPTLRFTNKGLNMFVESSLITDSELTSTGIERTKRIAFNNVINVNADSVNNCLSKLSFYCGKRKATQYDLVYAMLVRECRYIWQAKTQWRLENVSTEHINDANEFTMSLCKGNKSLLAKLLIYGQNTDNLTDNEDIANIGKLVDSVYRPLVHALRNIVTNR